jgi:hypothetical protein
MYALESINQPKIFLAILGILLNDMFYMSIRIYVWCSLHEISYFAIYIALTISC